MLAAIHAHCELHCCGVKSSARIDGINLVSTADWPIADLCAIGEDRMAGPSSSVAEWLFELPTCPDQQTAKPGLSRLDRDRVCQTAFACPGSSLDKNKTRRCAAQRQRLGTIEDDHAYPQLLGHGRDGTNWQPLALASDNPKQL